jgi:hypothetical protein
MPGVAWTTSPQGISLMADSQLNPICATPEKDFDKENRIRLVAISSQKRANRPALSSSKTGKMSFYPDKLQAF